MVRLVAAVASAENFGVAASVKPTLPKPRRPFRYCLNTATIRGQKIGIVKEIQVAAKAGYDAIEPWVDSIEDYLKNGGTLEKAAMIANHASTRTTQLYDRRNDEVSLDEVERILI